MTKSATRVAADGELFKSTGIDDNATSNAITIDASENVLVGKTTAAFGTAGIALRGTVADFTRSSGTPINVNRLVSDGSLIDLHKDGTVVGSIGIEAGGLVIDGESGHTGLRFANDSVLPRDNGTTTDGADDLGSTTARWKDLHLSGGVYLGGTGAANKLDDYEEGTFTPTIAVGTLTSGGALYTKIGNQVTITIDNLKLSDASSGSSINLGNMPFTCSSLASQGSVMIARKDTTEGVTAHISANSTSMFFYQNSTVDFDSLRHTALNAAGSNAWYITITYLAA